MALAPGAKLGPYEVQSYLGAGMGEVYHAREHAVAVKVLRSTRPQQQPERIGDEAAGEHQHSEH